jgi:cell division protein FtsL
MQDAKIEIRNIGSISVASAAKEKKGNILKEKYYSGRLVFMLILTSCIVITFSSIITKTRHDRLRMAMTKTRLGEIVAQLEKDSSFLNREQFALKSDSVRIEKEAREQLGYINPDEIIYERYNFHIKSVSPKEPSQTTIQNHWERCRSFIFDGLFPWQVPALIILFSAAYYVISYHYEYRKLHRPNC